MAPQIYEIDVHADGRKVDGASFRTTVDWADPVTTRRDLDDHIVWAAIAHRAIAADVTKYLLKAYPVDRDGQRGHTAVWQWRVSSNPEVRR